MNNNLVDNCNLLIQFYRVHSWGNDLKEAFVNSAHAMVNYMYERNSVESALEKEIEVEGNKMKWIDSIEWILIFLP